MKISLVARLVYWCRLLVYTISVSCVVASCGPPTRAAVGVIGSDSSPEVLVYVCDDQPNLTLRVYVDGQQPNAYFTIVGGLKKGQTVKVSLTRSSPGWHLEDGRPMIPGKTYVIDTEDGHGYRLGASIFFKLSDVPRAGVFTGLSEEDKSRVISINAFTRRARSSC